MKWLGGVFLGTVLSLLSVMGASALITGNALPATTSRADHTHSERKLHSLRMEVIVKSNSIGYFQTILAGAKKAAAQFGVQSLGFTGPNSEGDVAGQIRLVEDAIARHPDFIVISPNTVAKLNPAVAQAHRAGIKVIVVDSPLVTSDYRPADANDFQTYLSTDYYTGACRAANALAAAIKAKTGRAAGQVAYTTFFSTPAGQLRESRKGFTDCIRHYPGIHIVRHLDAGADPTRTERMAAGILAAFPHLVGFYADTTFTLQGAAQAFAQRKVDHKRVSLVGIQGYDLAGRDLQAHRLDGVILQDPFEMGYGGVAYGILAAAGLNIPKFVDSGVVLATPANVKSPFIQGLLAQSTHRPGIGF